MHASRFPDALKRVCDTFVLALRAPCRAAPNDPRYGEDGGLWNLSFSGELPGQETGGETAALAEVRVDA